MIRNEMDNNERRIAYGMKMINCVYKATGCENREDLFESCIQHLLEIFNTNNTSILNKVKLMEKNESDLEVMKVRSDAEAEELEYKIIRLEIKIRELELKIKELESKAKAKSE